MFDADHPARQARFGCAVLTAHAVLPYDKVKLARLAAQGLTLETEPVALITGPGPCRCFHLVTGPRPYRNRVHLDVAVLDRSAEILHYQTFGAAVRRQSQGYTVMTDPEGNHFCLTDG